jgi:hypothetical protein
VHGFPIIQKYDPQVSPFHFRNLYPTPNAAIRLDLLSYWIDDRALDPRVQDSRSIGSGAYLLEIASEPHPSLYQSPDLPTNR